MVEEPVKAETDASAPEADSEKSGKTEAKPKKRKPSKYNNIYDEIVKFVDKDRVTRDEYERSLYSHDVASLPKMMGMGFKFTPDIVIKPETTKEVSEIVKTAESERVPIIPRGGASWGLGGAVPVQGGIVLDLLSMDDFIELDEENLTVTVEAGMSWKKLDKKLNQKGYMIGSYPSSALSASIGGWINTGGAGIGSYKYGSAGDHIRSMEVVLPNGMIINTGFQNVISNSSGYNLNGLFWGAEGTLGVITKATLKIYPISEEVRPLSYEFSNIKQFCSAVHQIARAKIVPWHLGFLDKNHFDFLRKISDHTPEVSRMMLNVALEGDKGQVDYEEQKMDTIVFANSGTKKDRAVAQHEWDERYFEMRIKRLGPTLITGEAMTPISTMPNMLNGIYNIFKKMKLRAAITGFVSDRNTIAFMPYYLTDERNMIQSLLSMSFTKKLTNLAFKNGGRPAGLGIFFAVNLKKLHGNGVNLMWNLKSAIDPYNIMNPGKLLEGLTRFGIPIPPMAMNLGMDAMAVMKGIFGKEKEYKDKTKKEEG